MAKLILWWQVARPGLYFLGCVAFGAFAASVGGTLLAEYPGLVQVFIAGVAIFAGFGGLWTFWLLADGLGFARRGYRLRQLHSHEYWRWTPGPKLCVYEEWTPETGIRQFSFVREILADGYPAPSVVRIPGESQWETETPEWARGRRAEILQRIRECTGDNTQFAELERRAG